ncbi:hypothetical protein B0H14DRAFT_3606711 [Mycena olivaceomarginata]|nr:hypothetical protein B0H14DRAFT_3606711 [Mycena olivaceomarginata]
MALARLSTIPLELQYLASKELGPSDLLALSHVSTYWRAFVLSDKRWTEWFASISSWSDETLEQCLTRLNILDKLSKRKAVYLCLRDFARSAANTRRTFTSRISSVSARRVSKVKNSPSSSFPRRLRSTIYANGTFSIFTLEWRNPSRSSKRSIKLVSESHVKKIAIQNLGSEATLQAHLERKMAEARHTYTARSEDYRKAVSTRAALQETGTSPPRRRSSSRARGARSPRRSRRSPILLPACKADGPKVVCFAPRPLVEVGGELLLDVNDSDESKGSGADGSEA